MPIAEIKALLEKAMQEINSLHPRDSKAGEELHDTIEEAYTAVSEAKSALESVEDLLK